MFDIGWSELLVIGVVALVVIGPKELPAVLRTIGQWVGKVRRMASEFQGQFQDAMREAEMADLKKTFDDATTAKDYGLDFSAIGNIKQDMEKAVGELPASATDMSVNKPADPVATSTGPVAPEPAAPPEAAPAQIGPDDASPAPRDAVAEANSVTTEKQPS